MAESILIEFYPYDPATTSIKTVGFGSGLTRTKVTGSNVPYNLRLSSKFTHEISVYENDIPSGNKVSIGSIVIANADGKFDYLFGYEWGARQVKVYRGYRATQFSDYQLIFDGSTMGLTADRTSITFVVTERASLIPEVLQTNTYTGAGGAGGYIDLLGVPKPLCFGLCKNIRPILIDQVKQVYQVHDGTIEDIENVYDGGVPLTKGASVADLTALLNDANKPDNGSFRYTLSGYFRLGAPPAKFINADVRGEFYSQVNLADTLKQILLSRTSLVSGDLDTASFTALAAKYPGRISGLYYPALDVGFVEWIENIVASQDSFWYFNALGKLVVKPFAFGTPVSTIRNNNINNMRRENSSRPLKEVTVLYDRNSEVIPGSEFSLVVEDIDVYVANKVIRVATDGSGNGGTYSYTDQIEAVLNGELVSDYQAVTFYCAASWISLSPDGNFTISDPGTPTATATIRANYAEYNSDITLTLLKSMGASPFKNLTLSSTKYVFDYNQNGFPVTPGDNAVITATKTNVTGTLVWTAFDNVGQSVTLTGSGDSRTLTASNIANGPLVSHVDVRATAPDGTYNETRIVLSRGSTGYFNQIDDILNQINGKITAFYQGTAPSSGMSAGDLWFNTSTEKWYRYSGGTWVLTEDSGIGDALTAAAGAQATADGKVETFYQSSAPVTTNVGDLWVDTDEDPRRLRTWNGTSWEEVANVSEGSIYITPVAPDSNNSRKGDIWQDSLSYYWIRLDDVAIAVNGNQISVGGNDLIMTWTLNSEQPVREEIDNAAEAVRILALDAQATADGKIESFYQITAPSSGSVGDLWFDTDDGNKQYRYDGSAWVAVQDSQIGNALTAAAGAQATADGKVTTFINESTPTAIGVGDLWFKQSTGELRRWNGSSWGNPLVDLTANAQIVIVPPPTFTLYRTSAGAVKADQLPVDLTPSVTRGGTDVRTEDAVSYSVTGYEGLASKVTVQNTNGNSNKGKVTISNTVTGGGYFDLSVTYNSIAVGVYRVLVTTVDDLPPVDNGGAGGTDTTLAAVTGTSYSVMTGQDSGDPVLDVAITSGQTLNLTANFKYLHTPGTATGTPVAMTCKGQYSTDGTNWFDMNSATTEVTGSLSTASSDPEDREKGELIYTFQKTGLSTATYKVRLMGKKAATASGSLQPQNGGATSFKT